jgi:hypothetical protein
MPPLNIASMLSASLKEFQFWLCLSDWQALFRVEKRMHQINKAIVIYPGSEDIGSDPGCTG